MTQGGGCGDYTHLPATYEPHSNHDKIINGSTDSTGDHNEQCCSISDNAVDHNFSDCSTSGGAVKIGSITMASVAPQFLTCNVTTQAHGNYHKLLTTTEQSLTKQDRLQLLQQNATPNSRTSADIGEAPSQLPNVDIHIGEAPSQLPNDHEHHQSEAQKFTV
jgi:hypothetical protein